MKQLARKALSLILALALCMPLAVSALADEITNSSIDSTANTTVTYTVAEGYTVVIPPSVTIPSDAASTTLTVTLKSGAVFPSDKWLYVYLQDSANNFYLKTAAGDAISYSVVKQSGVTVKEGGWICRVAADSLKFLDNEITLTLTLKDSATAPGDYSDTLTFMAALEDASTT